MLERTAREAKRVPESTTRAPGSTNESRLDLREPRRSSSEPESESSPRERRMLERERSTESSESRPLIWLSSSMSAEESSSRENLLGGRAPGGEWLGGGGLSSSISTEIWEASRLILRFLGLRPKTMVERAANGDGPHGSVSELAAEPALANQHTVRCFYFYPAALFSQAFACSAGARCWLDVCEREREGNRPHSPTELFIIRPDFPHGVVRAWRALGAGLRTCLTRSTNWKRTSAYWRLASHRHGLDSTPSPLQLLPAFRSSTTLLTAHCSRSPLKSCRRHSFGTRRVAETKTVPPLTKKRSAPNIPSLPLLIVHGLLSR